MINVDELVCDESGYMMVRTRVSDTGIGMSQDYLTKIFDAFTRERNTTKSKITGSGLGMSIVKRYVDLLGGTIDVESEPGKGSTFTVTLKHRIADESYYVKKHDEGSGTASKILEGRNILLAEDNDLKDVYKRQQYIQTKHLQQSDHTPRQSSMEIRFTHPVRSQWIRQLER